MTDLRIVGFSSTLNGQLNYIPDIVRYFQELQANPQYAKTGEANHLLAAINDDGFRDTIEYIGSHNELPPRVNLKHLANARCIDTHRKVTLNALGDLESLMMGVLAEFMPEPSPDSVIRYSRQVALYCKGCGEVKASGHFDYQTKHMSYERIRFKKAHLIDPRRAEFRTKRIGKKAKKGGKRKPQTRRILYCKTCNSSDKRLFEVIHQGPYASRREYHYDQEFLDELYLLEDAARREAAEKGETEFRRYLPKVVSVSKNLKEYESALAKIAFKATGGLFKGGKIKGEFDKTLRQRVLEEHGTKTLETLELILSAEDTSIFDPFRMRIITPDRFDVEGAPDLSDCYEIMNWFNKKFVVLFQKDYFEHPKENNYRALHGTLIGLPSDKFTQEWMNTERIMVELQIRTQRSHLTAEHGEAAWPPEKDRDRLLDHKLLLAMTALRMRMFGI